MGYAVISAPVFAAMFGFHQAFGWDYVTIIAVMVGLVVIPSFIADKFLAPTTKAYFDESEAVNWKLLGGWVAFALIIYTISDTPFHRHAFNEFTAFAGLWWSCFPHYCALIVLLDRIFHVFDKKACAVKPLSRPQAHIVTDEPAEDDQSFGFNLERFKDETRH